MCVCDVCVILFFCAINAPKKTITWRDTAEWTQRLCTTTKTGGGGVKGKGSEQMSIRDHRQADFRPHTTAHTTPHKRAQRCLPREAHKCSRSARGRAVCGPAVRFLMPFWKIRLCLRTETREKEKNGRRPQSTECENSVVWDGQEGVPPVRSGGSREMVLDGFVVGCYFFFWYESEARNEWKAIGGGKMCGNAFVFISFYSNSVFSNTKMCLRRVFFWFCFFIFYFGRTTSGTNQNIGCLGAHWPRTNR